MLADLVFTRSQVAAGHCSAPQELERSIAAALGPACAHVFRQTCHEEARAAAAAPGVARLPLAKKDIASLLGTTPETLSRKLAAFAEAGLVEVQGREVVILDPVRLEERTRPAP